MGVVSPLVVVGFREKWAKLGTKQNANDDREREKFLHIFQLYMFEPVAWIIPYTYNMRQEMIVYCFRN
jgi:hypothetical protein